MKKMTTQVYKKGFWKDVDASGNETILIPTTVASEVLCSEDTTLEEKLENFDQRLEEQEVDILTLTDDAIMAIAKKRKTDPPEEEEEENESTTDGEEGGE